MESGDEHQAVLGVLANANGARAAAGSKWCPNIHEAVFEALLAELGPATRRARTEQVFCVSRTSRVEFVDGRWYAVRVEAAEPARHPEWWADARVQNVRWKVTRKPDRIRTAEALASKLSNPFQDDRTHAAKPTFLRRVREHVCAVVGGACVLREVDVDYWTRANANGLGAEYHYTTGGVVREVVVTSGSAAGRDQALAYVGGLLGDTPEARARVL